jgi:hypothetical protein
MKYCNFSNQKYSYILDQMENHLKNFVKIKKELG